MNDGAVIQGWSKSLGVPEDSLIQIVADTRGEVSKALDVVLDHPGVMEVLGNPRCKRFSMIIDDGVVRTGLDLRPHGGDGQHFTIKVPGAAAATLHAGLLWSPMGPVWPYCRRSDGMFDLYPDTAAMASWQRHVPQK